MAGSLARVRHCLPAPEIRSVRSRDPSHSIVDSLGQKAHSEMDGLFAFSPLVSDDPELRADAGSVPGIDPERLALALSVLAELEPLPPDHPDVLRARRAAARLYKYVKQGRRRDRRIAATVAD